MKNLLIVMLALIFASCVLSNKITGTDENSLMGKWELTVLDGQNISGGQTIFLELTDDNKVSGCVGCNRLSGIYSLDKGNLIRFYQLATTRMACPQMELETQVLKMLNKVENFVIKNDRLILNISRSEPLAIFDKVDNSKIVNRYWKLKILDGRTVKMVENQEKEQYFILRSDNIITGFAGCNHFNGMYELKEGNRIVFNDNMAVTMMVCPDIDLDERAFLKVFELADYFTIDGDTLILNTGQRAPLAVFEAVYFR